MPPAELRRLLNDLFFAFPLLTVAQWEWLTEASRKPDEWLTANRRAVEAMWWGYRGKVREDNYARMVSVGNDHNPGVVCRSEIMAEAQNKTDQNNVIPGSTN